MMRLSKHRAQYFNIPIHMIYSLKEKFDKRNPEHFFIDILTKDYREMRIKAISEREGREIMQSIYQQAFPQMIVSSLFVLNNSYVVNNYLIPEEVKEETENSIYDPISLTKSERLGIYINMNDFPVNGWDVYNIKREFNRQGVNERKDTFRKAC